jgi:parvulin-like peptidyl-prolyl isomerase
MEIKYSHGVITPEEVIRFLSFTNQLHSINIEIIKNKEVLKKAKELQISVSVKELQKCADSYRANHGLFSAERTYDFLNKAGLSEDDLEAFCENSILTAKLTDQLADDMKIEEYFVNNHSDFDLARIHKIVVKEKGLADEILIQIEEEEKDFHTGAREYSIDESTKYGGGYFGFVTRNMLQLDVAAKVFNASANDVLGPFEEEDLYELIKVEEVLKAELNDIVKEKIKKLLFEEWLTQFTKGELIVSS